jgi:uncharacterized protein (TIGR02266 family)
VRELLARPGRTDVELRAELVAGDGGTASGVTRNIGAGGAFIATDRPLPVGERLRLTFSLPDAAAPVSVGAEVRWMREGPSAGMGLRFVDPDVNATIAIRTFLNDREAAARNGSTGSG